MVEIDKVKSKILALLQKTTANGCSEKEALLAADKVGELLDNYNLSMNDIVINEASCVTGHYSVNYVNRHPIFSCFVHVGEFTDCRFWRSISYEPTNHTKYTKCKYFGFSHDVDYAVFLSEIIFEAMQNELAIYKASEEYKKIDGSKKSASTSFLYGMGDRICSRLDTMKSERDMRVAAEMASRQIESNCTSIVLAKKHEKIEEEYKKLGLKLTYSKYCARLNNYRAYSRGQNAANNVTLNRPMTNGNKAKTAIA